MTDDQPRTKKPKPLTNHSSQMALGLLAYREILRTDP